MDERRERRLGFRVCQPLVDRLLHLQPAWAAPLAQNLKFPEISETSETETFPKISETEKLINYSMKGFNSLLSADVRPPRIGCFGHCVRLCNDFVRELVREVVEPLSQSDHLNS